MILKALAKRKEDNNPIHVGIIGAGKFGGALVSQIYQMEGMVVSLIADVQIEDAIRSLPENFLLVILLMDVQGMSYQEISEIVDCPVGTVKSRVNRARLKLQQKLKSEGRDVGLQV